MSDENNSSTPPLSADSATPATAPDAPAPTSAVPPADDPLVPSALEKRELERFLNGGHRTHTTIFLWSFLGIAVFLGAMLYWNTFDYIRDPNTEQWQPFNDTLGFALKNQVSRDYSAVQRGKSPSTPRWPLTLYHKARFDTYLIGGVALLLALIIAKIEGAKAHRRELLIFRALLRENEKLRLRVQELSKK